MNSSNKQTYKGGGWINMDQSYYKAQIMDGRVSSLKYKLIHDNGDQSEFANLKKKSLIRIRKTLQKRNWPNVKWKSTELYFNGKRHKSKEI